MLWLEPLVEVETPAGRVGYGPVKASDVASLFDAGFLSGGAHPLSIGKVEEHPYFDAPAPRDLRALRRHRSAVVRRI